MRVAPWAGAGSHPVPLTTTTARPSPPPARISPREFYAREEGPLIFRPFLAFLAGIFFTLSLGGRLDMLVVVGYVGWIEGRAGASILTYGREATFDNPARDQSIRRCHDDVRAGLPTFQNTYHYNSILLPPSVSHDIYPHSI